MRSRGNMLRVALLSNSGHWTFTTITKLFVLLSPLLLGPCEREFSRNRWSQSISSASRYGWGRDYKSLWIRNKHWRGSQAASEQRCLAEQRLEGMAATFFGEKPAGSILRNAEKEAGRQRERDMSFPSWFSKNLPINVCSESDSTKFRQNLPSYPFRWLPAFRSNFLELQSPAAVNIFRVPQRTRNTRVLHKLPGWRSAKCWWGFLLLSRRRDYSNFAISFAAALHYYRSDWFYFSFHLLSCLAAPLLPVLLQQ